MTTKIGEMLADKYRMRDIERFRESELARERMKDKAFRFKEARDLWNEFVSEGLWRYVTKQGTVSLNPLDDDVTAIQVGDWRLSRGWIVKAADEQTTEEWYVQEGTGPTSKVFIFPSAEKAFDFLIGKVYTDFVMTR